MGATAPVSSDLPAALNPCEKKEKKKRKENGQSKIEPNSNEFPITPSWVIIYEST